MQLLRRKLFNEDGKNDFERTHRDFLRVWKCEFERVSKPQRESKANMDIKSEGGKNE